ncbi:MAG: hypothetical protein BGO38_16580 [Cellulomonas sp. 73-145]|uniref:SDR family NAD(P)-dependent oxidoreductase n=1 Tax=Cellulomonas sp. 73-145 TaxID=1895739 RepID=UPI000927BB21|nr:SDR family NAD(P)-dependent oxidoreductase [Cellulomonas sp. 73-145]OJV58943.1 MAG: hypothetical protein BGO38_16580 [Cellulomonas sp. 73-145]
MSDTASHPDLSGRHVLIPGGTGTVGEGAVRAYLAAGADVVVPSRTQARADELGARLADVPTGRLHLVVHDYTTFAGAAGLVETMVDRLGSVDDVVAPIGGWWWGKRLWEIDEADWQAAFVDLATAHMAVARAALPRLSRRGAYSIVVGQSANVPVAGSGLVSMEQSALQMLHRVLVAEAEDSRRVFLLELGPVASGPATSADPGQLTAEQVGAVVVAASALPAAGRHLELPDGAGAEDAVAQLRAAA